MEHSEVITELAAAMVAAQVLIGNAKKESENTFLKKGDGKPARYADLASVMDACKAALNGNGIAILQSPAPAEHGFLALDTVLMHKSGQWFSGRAQVPLPKNDPQGYGSALTYARRYALAAMVGVCPEDDDAEAAMGRGANAKSISRQQPSSAQDSLSNDDAFRGELEAAFQHKQITPTAMDAAIAKVIKAKKVENLEGLPLKERRAFIAAVLAGSFDPKKAA